MIKKAVPFIVSLAVSLGVGWLSAFLTKDGMSIFSDVTKPPLSPPAAVFPIVWSLLFVLMGIAAAIVWRESGGKAFTALFLYGFQLVLNFCWPIIFFNFGDFFFAFIWLLFLLGTIIFTAVEFYKVSKSAAYLLIPYILWVSFAGYLNLGIWLLNKE